MTSSLAQRLANAEAVVDATARNLDRLHKQLQAYGDVTAQAMADLEARLKAVEAHTHEPLPAVPV